MLDFMDAYTLWRKHPFPPSGTGDVLPEVKADLALADHYVTVVIRYVEHGVYQPAVPDVLALVRGIRHRLQDVMDAQSPELQAIARHQHAYAGLLGVLYERFLALAPDREGPPAR